MNARPRPPSMLALLLAAALAALCVLSTGTAQNAAGPPRVVQFAIEGPIGPATTDFVRRSLATAVERQAEAVLLRLDTPGGLAAATRDIDQAILASPIPVIAWVAPAGARAASAGTYIVYASHVAVMAPGTHLGSATPVPIGAPSSPVPRPTPAAEGGESEDKGAPSDPASAMERKVLHDSAAYIRSLAELRGRNAEWGERAVREGESLTADEALEQQVVEFKAADIDALLRQLDGFELKLGDKSITLQLAGAEVEQLQPDWRTQLLALITNPSVAYLLLLAGLYGLLLEGYNPGALLPGVVGVLCLLLAAYALQVLPVNYAGLALILVGLALMFAELLSPSFGVLGIGGVVALVLGSLVLFDTEVPGFGVSRGLIAGIAASSGATVLALLYFLGRARRQPRKGGGREELTQLEATALEDFDGEGRVRVRGEVWKAHSHQPVQRGQALCVEHVDGLVLHVRPQSAAKQGPAPA